MVGGLVKWRLALMLSSLKVAFCHDQTGDGVSQVSNKFLFLTPSSYGGQVSKKLAAESLWAGVIFS